MDTFKAFARLILTALTLFITGVVSAIDCPYTGGTRSCPDICCIASVLKTFYSDVCCTSADITNNALNTAGDIVSTGISTVIIVVIVVCVIIALGIIACIVCCVCAATKKSAGSGGAVVAPANPNVVVVPSGQAGPPPNARPLGPPPTGGGAP